MRMTQYLRGDKLVAASSIMFVSFIVASVSNYAFQLLMGRLLTPTNYGTLNTLLSAMVIFSVPLGAAQLVVSRRMASTHARGALGEARTQLNSSLRITMVAGCVIGVLWLLFFPFIRGLFPNASGMSVAILGACIAVGCLPPIAIGAAQGLQRFFLFASASALQGILKLVFGVVAVTLSLGVAGVMWGMALSGLVVFFVAAIFLWRLLQPQTAVPTTDQHTISGVLAMLLGSLGFTILTQADMLFIAHTLSPTEAGHYAAAAVLGKAVMYLPGSIVLAMFPMVSAAHVSHQDTRPLLLKALAISVALSSAAATCFAVAPEPILRLLFNETYVAAAVTLRWFGFVMLPFAAALVLLQYTLARGSVAPGLIATTVATSFVLVQLFAARGTTALLQSLALHGVVLAGWLAAHAMRSHRFVDNS